ncbi:MAG: hypothetical protein EXS08_07250 [Planctomycetes bacterium]|nr:hypothetical protein [Planctomycetota bacterium]
MFLTVLVLSFVLSQDKPPEDPLLAVPEDALLVASLIGLDELRARSADNAWVALFADEELAPLRAELERLLGEALAEDQDADADQAWRDPRAWWRAVHGSAQFFMTESMGIDVGGVFVGVGEERAELDELLDGLRAAHRSSWESSSSEYNGIPLEFEVLAREPEDDAEEPQTHLVFFECAGRRALVIGDDRERTLEVAQAAIDRMSGRDPSRGFAGRAELAEARQASGHPAVFEAFIDLPRIVKLALARGRAQGKEDVDKTEHVLERLGLDTTRWLYTAIDVGADERFDWTLGMQLAEGKLLQRGLANFGPLPADGLRLAPPESLGVALAHLDVAGLWTYIQELVAELDPPSAEKLKAALSQFEPMFGFDLESELLQRIQGDVISFEVPVSAQDYPAELRALLPEGVPLSSAATLIVLHEGEAVGDVVDGLLEKFGMAAQIESAEFQGHYVQSLAPVLNWAFTEEGLVLGELATPVRTLLSRLGTHDGPSLAGDERFSAALARHRGAAALRIGRSDKLFEGLLAGIRVGLGMQTSLAESSDGSDAAAQRFLAVLPGPGVIAKHFDGVMTLAFECGSDRVLLRAGAR